MLDVVAVDGGEGNSLRSEPCRTAHAFYSKARSCGEVMHGECVIWRQCANRVRGGAALLQRIDGAHLHLLPLVLRVEEGMGHDRGRSIRPVAPAHGDDASLGRIIGMHIGECDGMAQRRRCRNGG